jgi:thiamine-phosphate pyrophosphorylase
MEHAIYRIIDANFNRSREALRVIEDFCRFYLNSAPLASRCKQLRHELCTLLGQLESGKLFTSRDVDRDIGIGVTVPGQMGRGELKDTFTAAARRLTEALRCLSETVALTNTGLAAKIENLRYAAYTLEKDIAIFSSTVEKFRAARLYIVITSNHPADIFFLTESCIAGGADCIQIRVKQMEDDKLFALAEEFVRACRADNCLSIINDRADIAIAAGADGVHLGQNDLPIEQAFKLQLSPLIIGKSTHSMEQLKAACTQPITYAALGPVFATPTKPSAPPVGLGYVRDGTSMLADTGIAHVAIGGIKLDNIEQVLKAGARTIAISSAVTNCHDPKGACQLFKEKILSFKEQ